MTMRDFSKCDHCGGETNEADSWLIFVENGKTENWCNDCWERRAIKCPNCYKWSDDAFERCPLCDARFTDYVVLENETLEEHCEENDLDYEEHKPRPGHGEDNE